MDLIKLVQVANNFCKSINDHYSDLAEIDLMINKLENSRRHILNRMYTDSNYLKMMIESDDIKEGCTDTFIAECKELIDSVKSYLKEGE